MSSQPNPKVLKMQSDKDIEAEQAADYTPLAMAQTAANTSVTQKKVVDFTNAFNGFTFPQKASGITLKKQHEVDGNNSESAETAILKLCESLDYPEMMYTRELNVPDNFKDASPSCSGCTQNKAMKEMLSILKIPL